ncbi:MAG: MBOAT family O-acyltransferase [Verrucomicrobiales bacterium]
MVFSSHIFLFYFLPFALLVYYATPSRGRALSLTLLSYLFYGWWNPWFAPLMLGSTLIDYACGRTIAAPGQSRGKRKAATIVSVVANLGILGFFKYAVFVSENLGWGFGLLGLDAPADPDFLSRIVLPVGISFYTFQSMSYSIDLYRGHAKPARNLVDFACYVSMFPQLVAGPIVRYGSVAGQLRERTHSLEGFVAGFTRFNYGFARKILLANPMGEIADLCFEAGDGSLTCLLAWTGALAYAFQIYFDFSGYSDMALGLGRMLGFRFPENFASPYKARSLTDFWRRWHISLSSFLRDYLYIPLGGNRKGRARTYVNLVTVMLIGGLWHGAQWTFVVWGGLHGLGLAVERWWRERTGIALPGWIAGPATFAVLLITWVFFRAESLEVALRYLAVMSGVAESDPSAAVLSAVVFRPFHLVMLGASAVAAWWLPNTGEFLKRVTGWKILLGLILLALGVRAMGLQGFNPFLYFQF